MKKRMIALLVATVGVGCAPLPPPQVVSGPAVSAPQSAAPARSGVQNRRSQANSQAQASVGRAVGYAGRGDGSRITASLTQMADGQTRAEGATSGTGGGPFCAGQFSGVGTFQGDTLRIREASLPGCEVVLVRRGRRLSIDANGPNCVGLSGMNCSLSGDLTQQ